MGPQLTHACSSYVGAGAGSGAVKKIGGSGARAGAGAVSKWHGCATLTKTIKSLFIFR